MNDWSRENDTKLRNNEAQADLTEAHVGRVVAESHWFDAKVKALQTARILAYVVVAAGVVRAFI